MWTDESTLQLDTHRRFCCWKRGQKPRYKPHPKHPTKVHVWAGISYRGSTRICIFDGIMNADLYVQILEECLLPFLQQTYPDGHRFMQDYDPKHTSLRARQFFNNVNWWKSPPESPDANPIENLWHELKNCPCMYNYTLTVLVYCCLLLSNSCITVCIRYLAMCYTLEIQKGKNPRANLTTDDEGKCGSENVGVR